MTVTSDKRLGSFDLYLGPQTCHVSSATHAYGAFHAPAHATQLSTFTCVKHVNTVLFSVVICSSDEILWLLSQPLKKWSATAIVFRCAKGSVLLYLCLSGATQYQSLPNQYWKAWKACPRTKHPKMYPFIQCTGVSLCCEGNQVSSAAVLNKQKSSTRTSLPTNLSINRLTEISIYIVTQAS